MICICLLLGTPVSRLWTKRFNYYQVKERHSKIKSKEQSLVGKSWTNGKFILYNFRYRWKLKMCYCISLHFQLKSASVRFRKIYIVKIWIDHHFRFWKKVKKIKPKGQYKNISRKNNILAKRKSKKDNPKPTKHRTEN